MVCKKCGKELENNVMYCSSCGEMNGSEITCEQRGKVNIKKNLSENVYKILLAVANIVVFFLPWVNWIETHMNFFEVNILISTAEKLRDGVLGIFSGDVGSVSKLMNLDADTVMKIFNICWEDRGESIIFMQSSRWILFVLIAIILINISYVVLLILGKERNWMMVGLIILHLVFSFVVMMITVLVPTEMVGLSFGPVIMFVIQGVLGELAAQREVDLRRKAS